ncbi:MAG: hypothetical protein COA42_02860 [Alteromonadaceae bacterium]|nr:MAG: hypothetical protein COA42_02860 [Alteromonadaceae bacterium]
MTRVHVFCEGQTEETFVRDVLAPYFLRSSIYLNPIIVRTSATGKGGAVSYAKIKRQVENKCKEDEGAWVTTLLDYYALPTDFPGLGSAVKIFDIFQKMTHIERAINTDINQPKFFANLLLHEFEGLLFSDVSRFGEWFDDAAVAALVADRANFASPEHINDGPTTAPSKRVLKYCEAYNKPLHGALIAEDIGLDSIRQECKHFSAWLTKVQDL